MPMANPPIAGHHIQWIFSRWKASSAAYTDSVSRADRAPARRPTMAHPSSPFGPMNNGWTGTGNSGPNPKIYLRTTAAIALANATGIRLRGFHLNSPIKRSNASATNAQATPITVANKEMGTTRHVVVKSPNSSLRSGRLMTGALFRNSVSLSLPTIALAPLRLLIQRALVHRRALRLRRRSASIAFRRGIDFR